MACFSGDRVVRLSRLRFETAHAIRGVRYVGFGGEKRVAGAEGQRRDDQPGDRAGEKATATSSRRGFGGPGRFSAGFGRGRVRIPAIIRFARRKFPLDDLRLAPGVTIDRGAGWPSGKVLYFLVDHRLALSIFSCTLYTGRPERREPAELLTQASKKPSFVGRFGNCDVSCADCLQRLCNVARNADMLKPEETILRAGRLRQRRRAPGRTA